MDFADTSDAVMFVAVVLARFAVPLLIPRFPLPAIVAALLIDAADQSIFQRFGDVDLSGYQPYDKALDIHYLAIAYASTLRNWDRGPVFQVARFLWYYRLVGVVLFEVTQARPLLIIFPNTFEYFFIVIETMLVTRNPFVLSMRQSVMLAGFIWIFIKLPQEWWLHIAQLDVTDTVKQFFGVAPDSTWGEAIANRPFGVVWLFLGAAVLVEVLLRLWRLLPSRQWPATWSADGHAARLGWPPPPECTAPTTFFGWPFVEKTALVTLVTLIFVQILPGTDRNIIELAFATATIIAVNILVSQWLARRGVTWRSTLLQFITMLGVNIGTALAAFLLLRELRSEAPLPVALFLLGLLTLIVVLFDRYHAIGLARLRREPPAPATPGPSAHDADAAPVF